MNLATYKLFVAIGLLVNSALYLGGCLVLGIVLERPLVWRLALAALGVTYLSYLFHTVSDIEAADAFSRYAPIIVFVSIALGAAAGIALLF